MNDLEKDFPVLYQLYWDRFKVQAILNVLMVKQFTWNLDLPLKYFSSAYLAWRFGEHIISFISFYFFFLDINIYFN